MACKLLSSPNITHAALVHGLNFFLLYFVPFEITMVFYLYAAELNGILGGGTNRQRSQSGSYLHKPSDTNLPNLPLVPACITCGA